ncbi:unnamed protein product, partial [Prorocentrum cordatum]
AIARPALAERARGCRETPGGSACGGTSRSVLSAAPRRLRGLGSGAARSAGRASPEARRLEPEDGGGMAQRATRGSHPAPRGADVEELLAAMEVANEGSHRTKDQKFYAEEAMAAEVQEQELAEQVLDDSINDNRSQEQQEPEVPEASDADFKSTTGGEGLCAIKVVNGGAEAESAEKELAEACALLAVLQERLAETDIKSFHEYTKLFVEAPTAVQQASWQDIVEDIRGRAVECEPL